MTRVPYDEFALFHENCAEHGLITTSPPVVRRVNVEVEPGRHLSALRWGDGDARLVLVHGGAQNAHTWDTVALALGLPLIAVDLPGHGHSAWRDDGRYTPDSMAADVAVAIEALAPRAEAVVGMSLGGLTSVALTGRAPHLVPRLGLIDITPGVNQLKAKAVIDFVDGPQSFPRFDDLLARTMAHHPTRSESSLRRGILHNARQLDDHSWVWRYDRRSHARSTEDRPDSTGGMSALWDVLGSSTCPLLLVRGGASPVVDDDDVAELRRRRHDARLHVIDGAGHSVQGDRPVELAAVLTNWLDSGS
jgi:pimeloyl-ACP methyl ester carboxylesterase